MKRLIIYLAVTFGLTWGLQIPAGIALGTFQNGEGSSMAMIALIAVSMFFPAIGALVANYSGRPEERIDLCVKPRISQNIRQYLVAWFLPTAIALVGCVVFFTVNSHLFDPTMNTFIEATAASAGMSADDVISQMPPMQVIVSAVIVGAIVIAPFINMIPAFGEELGWRGMLFPTLSERMSQRSAALLSGVIWGLWHAPIIAMGHNYGMGYAGFPVAGILTMVLLCTAMGCWLALLRVRTQSVWPCALAHGAFNAIANIGLFFCIGGATLFGPSPLGLLAGIPLMAVGIISWLKLERS